MLIYVVSYLLPEKGRNSKQKTPVAKRTVNPVWNYSFVYEDVTLQELAERCLELTVWDHDRLASNEFLGGVRFSLGTGRYSIYYFIKKKTNKKTISTILIYFVLCNII